MHKLMIKTALIAALVSTTALATPKGDDSMTSVDTTPILVPTVNPVTGEMIYVICNDFPHCDDVRNPPSANPQDIDQQE